MITTLHKSYLISLTVGANTWTEKNKFYKKADRGRIRLLMCELKFPLSTNSPSGVTPPLWARRCLPSIKSTKPPECPHWGVTSLFLPTASEELSVAPAAPQVTEAAQRGGTHSQECRPSTSVLGFPCCSTHSKPPDAGCDHSTRSEVMLQACSNFSAFLAEGWISLLWASPAGAQLCSSAVPAPSLISLPTACLKQCSEQEKERNQGSQNLCARARHFHLQHTACGTTDPLNKMRGKQPGQMWSRWDGSRISSPGLLSSGGKTIQEEEKMAMLMHFHHPPGLVEGIHHTALGEDCWLQIPSKDWIHPIMTNVPNPDFFPRT